MKKHLSQRELDIWSIDSAFMSPSEFKKALRIKLPLIFWRKAWLDDQEKIERKALREIHTKHNRNKALRDRVVIDTLPHTSQGCNGSKCRYCGAPMTVDYSLKEECFCTKCYAIRLPKICNLPALSVSQTRRIPAAIQTEESEFSRLKNFKAYLQKIQGQLGLYITNEEIGKIKEMLGGREPEYEVLRNILHELDFRHIYASIHALQKRLGHPLPVYSEEQTLRIIDTFLQMGFDKKGKGLLHSDILALVLQKSPL